MTAALCLMRRDGRTAAPSRNVLTNRDEVILARLDRVRRPLCSLETLCGHSWCSLAGPGGALWGHSNVRYAPLIGTVPSQGEFRGHHTKSFTG